MLTVNTKLPFTIPGRIRFLSLSAPILFLLCGLEAHTQPPSETDLNYYLSGSKNTADIIRDNRIHKELIYRYSFDRHGRADTVLTDSVVYNGLGQVLRSAEFINLPQMRTLKRFIYDSLGRVQKMLETHAFFNGLTWSIEYLYDSAGHKIAEGQHYGPGFAISEKRAYDQAGRLTGIYKDNGVLQTQFFYADGTGLLEKIVDYRLPKLKRVTYEYTYSITERERKIVEIGRGTYRLYEEAFFDDLGRIVRTLSRQMKIEEDNGSRWLLPDFFTDVVGTFSYNNDGTLLEWTEYRGKRSVAVYHHVYETY
jgi:hypothetical protein